MLPYACFACRKSFKRVVPHAEIPDRLPCPQCGGDAHMLSRKFKPPCSADVEQWRKVEALVAAGFRFSGWVGEPYPSTLAEVPGFVERERARRAARTSA